MNLRPATIEPMIELKRPESIPKQHETCGDVLVRGLSHEALQESHSVKELPLGIHSMVTLNGDPAAVPDLLSLELLIDKAINKAA